MSIDNGRRSVEIRSKSKMKSNVENIKTEAIAVVMRKKCVADDVIRILAMKPVNNDDADQMVIGLEAFNEAKKGARRNEEVDVGDCTMPDVEQEVMSGNTKKTVLSCPCFLRLRQQQEQI